MANRWKWCLAALLCAAAANAESGVQGPRVGWIWDANSQTLRAILGIPGSSVVSPPLETGLAVSSVAIAANGDSALLVDNEQGVFALALRDGGVPRRLAVPAGATRVAVSAQGKTAAVYYAANSRLLLLDLAASEPVVGDFDLSAESPADSPLDALAVADDGSGAAFRVAGRVMMARTGGNRWKVEGIEAAESLAFLDGTRDLLVAAANGTALVRDALGDGSVRRIRESAARAASAVGGRALVLEETGLVAVDLESGAAEAVECSCEPSLVERLSNTVFRLNSGANTDGSSAPLWLADVSQKAVRTVFVPAAQ